MTAAIQRSVDFHGDGLVVVQQDGTDYTPVKPLCDILGIDWEAQRRRIQADDVLADVAEITTVYLNGDARSYPLLCLPLDYLHGWLFGVNGNLIRPELRERLVLYKRECYRALAAAFRGAGAGAAPLARVDALEQRVAQLEAAKRAPQAALPVAAEELSPQQAAIIDMLKAHPHGGPVHAQAIIAALRQAGHHVATRPTNLRLRRMAARGLIVRCGRSIYRLA